MKSEVENIDCLIGMARYPDKHFELAIVDPPYGIGINMNMGRRAGKKKMHEEKDWDETIPKPAYFLELARVSKNQIIWGGNFADGELAWTSFDKTLTKAKIKYTGFQGMDHGGKLHPTQKPIKLYKWLLKNYAQPGDKILDTHLGSGSSRIAADTLGFDFTGFEIDKDYFDAQEKRFNNYKLQLTLFK